jgi:hypothetical protein
VKSQNNTASIPSHFFVEGEETKKERESERRKREVLYLGTL